MPPRTPNLGGFALVITAILCVAGCDDPDRSPPLHFQPHVADELVPPVLDGLIVGRTTLAQARARFDVERESRDVRYGGARAVGWNGRPAIVLQVEPTEYRPQMRLVFAELDEPDEPDDAPLVDVRLRVHPTRGTSVCDWVRETYRELEHADDCEGAFHTHVADDGVQRYCIGTTAGTAPIIVGCARRSVRGTPIERFEMALVTLR